MPSRAPLEGRRVLLACSEQTARKLLSTLASLGGAVRALPVIRIRGIEDKSKIDQSFQILQTYDWIIFTSSYGVQHFIDRMEELALPLDVWQHRRVCAVGPGTARTLAKRNIPVAMIPDDHVAEGILDSLRRHYSGGGSLAGLKFLLPRAREARDILPRELSRAGGQVDVVVCYETVRSEASADELAEITLNPPDLLIFSSSSTVHGFMEMLGEDQGRHFLESAVVAAIGPVTAGTIASFGKTVDILPEKHNAESLIAAIGDYFSSPNRG